VLYTFTGLSDGSGPRSNMVFDSAGNLYGTTQYGGTFQGNNDYCRLYGCGVVFELNPMGQETVLYSFSGTSDGAEPGTGLIRDSAGNLYGTTPWGGVGDFSSGSTGYGVVYKVSPGLDSPAQLQPVPKSFNPPDVGPKHALQWDLEKAQAETGKCPSYLPTVLARACHESAR
jgi:uncharacterized repeat protein (TIGR03803 family)